MGTLVHFDFGQQALQHWQSACANTNLNLKIPTSLPK
jgi:hypothetical protein